MSNGSHIDYHFCVVIRKETNTFKNIFRIFFKKDVAVNLELALTIFEDEETLNVCLSIGCFCTYMSLFHIILTEES